MTIRDCSPLSGLNDEYEKFLQSRRKFSRLGSSKSHSDVPSGRNFESKRRGPHCLTCGGYGHDLTECTNKVETAYSSWSDSNESCSSSNHEDVPIVGFIAREDSSSPCHLDNCSNVDSDEDIGQDVLEANIEGLFNGNAQDINKFKSLCMSILELEEKCQFLSKENLELKSEVLDKNSHINTLSLENDELKVSVGNLRKEVLDLTICQAKIDNVHTLDVKSDIGFVEKSSISSSSKTNDVVALDSTPIVIESLKPKSFVPTCHHCGKIGHIKPRCNIYRKTLKSPSSPPIVRELIRTKKKFIPTCHNCGKIGHVRPKCNAPKKTCVFKGLKNVKGKPRKAYIHTPSHDTSLKDQMQYLLSEVVKLSRVVIPQTISGSSSPPLVSNKKVWVKKVLVNDHD
jgi:hypothetical protein